MPELMIVQQKNGEIVGFSVKQEFRYNSIDQVKAMASKAGYSIIRLVDDIQTVGVELK